MHSSRWASIDPAQQQRLLTDPEVAVETRRAAAIELGRKPGPDRLAAQAALLRAVGSDSETRVILAAAKALGWIGDAVAYPALAAAARSHQGPGAEQIRWAARLIAARARIAASELGPLAVGPVLALDVGDLIEVNPARADTLARCLADLASGPFALDLDPTLGIALACHGAQRVLLFDRSLRGDTDFGAIPSNPAVIATWLPDIQRYAVSHIVLHEPGSDPSLVVCRSTGEPVFAGSASMEADQLRFSVAAVERPGAFGLRATGRVRRDGVTIDEARAGPIVVPKRRPLPLAEPLFRP
ncbi:MAG: HEAT repeat domain-containing protein [Ilumatobacteraceae bacterium]